MRLPRVAFVACVVTAPLLLAGCAVFDDASHGSDENAAATGQAGAGDIGAASTSSNGARMGIGVPGAAGADGAAGVVVHGLAADLGIIAVGEPLRVTVSLQNTGATTGIVEVALVAGETVVTSDTLTVDAGAQLHRSYRIVFDEPGTYELAPRVEGAFVSVGPISIDVVQPGVFVIEALSVSPRELELGSVVRVEATVKNLGATPVSGRVAALAGGAPVGAAPVSVELEPDATRDITITGVVTVAGHVPLRLTISSSSETAEVPLYVRGHRLENVTGQLLDTWCDERLRYRLEVDNAGDGHARDTLVTAIVLLPDGSEHSRWVAPPVDILAASRAAIDLPPRVEQRCGEEDTYLLRVLIEPKWGEAIHFDAGTFVV